MSKQDKAATAILSAIADHLQTLREKGRVAVPSNDTAWHAVYGCINSKTGQWRKTKPADDTAGLLWQLVRFHRGSGSLWGFPWFADETKRDELDTLAIVLLGGRSSAADAWKKALAC